jgi:hypothetical protein
VCLLVISKSWLILMGFMKPGSLLGVISSDFYVFFHERNLIILTNGFQKKTQACPESEIEIAEKRKKDYLRRYKDGRSR